MPNYSPTGGSQIRNESDLMLVVLDNDPQKASEAMQVLNDPKKYNAWRAQCSKAGFKFMYGLLLTGAGVSTSELGIGIPAAVIGTAITAKGWYDMKKFCSGLVKSETN